VKTRRSIFSFIAVLSSAVFAETGIAHSQELSLIRDIATEPNGFEKFNFFGRFASLEDVVFYVDDDGIHGEELWRTDGTGTGTRLVADLNPGFLPSNPWDLTPFGEYLYFTAYGTSATPRMQRFLWRTDGTPAGTERVVAESGDLRVSSLIGLVELNGALLFQGSTDAAGQELWRLDADGTPSLLVDIEPGPDGSRPANFIRIGDLVYFSAATPSEGRELWKTDGTAHGTSLVVDLFAGPSNALFEETLLGGFRYFGELAGALIFTADDGTGRHLWRTTGTASDTRKLAELFDPSLFTPLGSELLFCAAEETFSGDELWKTDGTPEGTTKVRDIAAVGGSDPSGLTVLGGLMYFAANDGVHGRELWVTDGTEAGTQLFLDINPGSESSSPGWFLPNPIVGNRMLFHANDGTHGQELWQTDGAVENTSLVRDIFPGDDDAIVDLSAFYGPFVAPTDRHIVLFADSPDAGVELWRSDGTEEGTQLVRDVYTQSSSVLGPLIGITETEVNDERLFFRAFQNGVGSELFVTDGTEAGTQLVADIFPGERAPGLAHSSYPQYLTAAGEWTYFSAADEDGEELWRTHTESLETEQVADLDESGSSSPQFIQSLGDLVLFTARNDDERQLFVTDGTAQGTLPLTSGGNAGAVATGQAITYFTFSTPTDGSELWVTDGTTEGTRIVLDLRAGFESSAPSNLLTVGDLLLFTAETDETGREWWRSDGTAEGTTLLADIEPGPGSGADRFLVSAPWSLSEEPIVAHGLAYFFAGSAETGIEIWTTDGTETGTQLLRDIRPGAESSEPMELVASGDLVYFSADDGVHGRELWVTDGTPAGTVLVGDLEPGSEGSNPWFLMDRQGELLFSANRSDLGVELWTSNGTDPGTRPVADLNPGPASGSPHLMTVVGKQVVLFGTNGKLGFEPLVIKPSG